MAASLVVGFDLDMTLIDSRPGIAATYRALAARTGVPVDVDTVVNRLGPPLEDELANWYPAGEVDAAATIYRELYPRYAIEATAALPGARAALAAVREAGGRAVVITAKRTDFAWLHLHRLELPAADVAGLAWADGKRRALVGYGAGIYVGDHTADVAAARAAGAHAVGVTTGPCTVDQLWAAGAGTVLSGLLEFPDWLFSRSADLSDAIGVGSPR